MRKLGVVVGVALGLLLRPGAAQAAEKKITIAVTWSDLANEFAAKMESAAKAEAKKLGVTLIEADGQGDPTKQVAQAENFVTQKVDVIILHPYDNSGSAPVVDIAKKAGIPVVLVNSFVTNAKECRVYVGSDDVYAGELEAGEMAKALGGKGNIVIMDGPVGSSPQINREIGYKHVLQKYPDIKVLSTQPADWDRAKALALTENWVQSGLPINGILSENDEMAMGAVAGLAERGKTGTMKVMGIDAIPDATRAVSDGRLAATVFLDAVGMGVGAVDAAVKLARKQSVPDKIIIPFVLVTKDNVSTYLAKK